MIEGSGKTAWLGWHSDYKVVMMQSAKWAVYCIIISDWHATLYVCSLVACNNERSVIVRSCPYNHALTSKQATQGLRYIVIWIGQFWRCCINHLATARTCLDSYCQLQGPCKLVAKAQSIWDRSTDRILRTD